MDGLSTHCLEIMSVVPATNPKIAAAIKNTIVVVVNVISASGMKSRVVLNFGTYSLFPYYWEHI